jgi:outer membrane protein assembly factor BamD (BamD/ComL family)
MTYRIKVPAKTLPVDEAHLVSGLEHALLRLQEYRRPLLVGAAVVLLAVAVVGGVLWFDRQAAQKAQELEREAMLHVLAAASNPQKAEASLKQAIATFRQIVDQYPRTPTAPLALFQAGNALVQTNDLGGAIEAYQRFIALYGSNPGFAGLVQQRLAYAYLLKGDRDQAVKALTGILELPGALNRDQALFELARLEESRSRPEGALAHFQELIKTYPNSPFASEATIRTKILDVKKAADPAASTPVPQTPSASSPAADQKKP